MTELLLNVVLCLYPREWRSRYGGEIRELIEVLNAEERRPLVTMMPGLVVGATIERFYAMRRFDRAGLAAATVGTVIAVALASHGLGVTRGQASARALRPAAATAGERTQPPRRARAGRMAVHVVHRPRPLSVTRGQHT